MSEVESHVRRSLQARSFSSPYYSVRNRRDIPSKAVNSPIKLEPAQLKLISNLRSNLAALITPCINPTTPVTPASTWTLRQVNHERCLRVRGPRARVLWKVRPRRMSASIVRSVVEIANVETCQDIHQYVWSRVARETEPTKHE